MKDIATLTTTKYILNKYNLNALKKFFSHTSGKKHKFCEKIFKIYQKKGNIYSEGRKNK